MQNQLVKETLTKFWAQNSLNLPCSVLFYFHTTLDSAIKAHLMLQSDDLSVIYYYILKIYEDNNAEKMAPYFPLFLYFKSTALEGGCPLVSSHYPIENK
jgi:hypothetical protein